MIEKDDYEALEWHNEDGNEDQEKSIAEVLPSPLNGLESILILTLVAAAVGRKRDELSDVEHE